jgi:hypothetical protein
MWVSVNSKDSGEGKEELRRDQKQRRDWQSENRLAWRRSKSSYNLFFDASLLLTASI